MNRSRKIGQTKPRGPARGVPTVRVPVTGTPTLRVGGFDIGTEPTIELAPGAGIGMRSIRATDRVKVTMNAQAALDAAATAQAAADEALLGHHLLVEDGVSNPPVTLWTDDGLDWMYEG